MVKSKSIDEILSGWNVYSRPKKGDIFRHYKGSEYEIVETGFIENGGEPAIIYKSLDKGVVWIRTAENFYETIVENKIELQRFKQQITASKDSSVS